MRHTLFTILGLLILSLCQAQQHKALVYANLAGELGSPLGFRASLSCLFERHHEISFNYNYYSRRGPDIPANYDEGGLINLGIYYPTQTYNGVRLTYNYILYPKRHSDFLRFKFGGGLGYGMLSTPGNYSSTNSGGIFSFKSWHHERTDVSQASAVVEAGLHFTPTRGFGLSASPFAFLSDGFSGGGVSLGLMFGDIGGHRYPRRPETEAQMQKRLERQEKRAERTKRAELEERNPETPYP